jgi:transcriptional regulator with XRE-family HTH domain
MTQEELAEKVGTTKSYISKIENNIKEARISTLQKIVELGFGGQLTTNLSNSGDVQVLNIISLMIF